MKAKRKEKPSKESIELKKQEAYLARLLEQLDVSHKVGGHLEMYPGADMRWYAATVEIAGLLQDAIQLLKIETLLLEMGIRSNGDVEAALGRLIRKLLVERENGP